MAITFPRELLTYRMSVCMIELDENVSASPSDGGKFINLSQVNDPVHRVTIQTGLLDVAEVAAWSAWKKSLRGGFKTFLAYDVRRQYLLAYPTAKTPAAVSAGWNGLATVTSVGLSGVLGLSGLPASLKLTAGDRVGLQQNGYYGYYEILESVTASAGGAASVTVAPLLHTRIFTTSAVARIWQARCQFVIDWKSWVEPGEKEPGYIEFNGVQKL